MPLPNLKRELVNLQLHTDLQEVPPLPTYGPDDASPWYETILVGKNKLSNMVEEMCEELQVFWFDFWFFFFCSRVQKWNALVYHSLVRLQKNKEEPGYEATFAYC